MVGRGDKGRDGVVEEANINFPSGTSTTVSPVLRHIS